MIRMWGLFKWAYIHIVYSVCITPYLHVVRIPGTPKTKIIKKTETGTNKLLNILSRKFYNKHDREVFLKMEIYSGHYCQLTTVIFIL